LLTIQVWLHTGVYRLSGPVIMRDGISILGGHTGSIESPGQRVLSPWSTSIVAAQGQRVIEYNGGGADTYGVVLDRLTISNGSASRGGGFDCLSGIASLIDVVFMNNGASERGGAVSLDQCHIGLMQDVQFTGNWAPEGAALNASNTEMNLIRPTFASNQSSHSSLLLENTTAYFSEGLWELSITGEACTGETANLTGSNSFVLEAPKKTNGAHESVFTEQEQCKCGYGPAGCGSSSGGSTSPGQGAGGTIEY
jgi:predicted outer membrane repeat protein